MKSRYPLDFTKKKRKISRYLRKGELISAIELFNETIQNTSQEGKHKAAINGILQSYNVSSLSKARNLIDDEQWEKNKQMLIRNVKKQLEKHDKAYFRWTNRVLFEFIIYTLFVSGVIFLFVYNNWFKSDFESLEKPTPPPIVKIKDVASYPNWSNILPLDKSVWYKEINEKIKKEDFALNENSPIFSEGIAVHIYDHTSPNKLMVKGEEREIRGFEKYICIASFSNEELAEKFSVNETQSQVVFVQGENKYRVVLKDVGNFKSVKRKYRKAWKVNLELI